MKAFAFILLIIGTIGLLVFEFIEVARYLTLIAAGLNALGLIILACSCSCKNPKVQGQSTAN